VLVVVVIFWGLGNYVNFFGSSRQMSTFFGWFYTVVFAPFNASIKHVPSFFFRSWGNSWFDPLK